MDISKKSFILSIIALALCILIWKELFVFTKAKVYFPNWGHFLTFLSLIPVLLITPEKDNFFKKISFVVLGIPALVIGLTNIAHDQFIAKTLVDFSWVIFLNTIPIAIILGLIRLIILKKRN